MFKKIFKHKFILFSLIFLVVALVIVYKALNSSVSVNLSSSSSNNSDDYSINLTPKTISDKYVAFNYPKGLTLKSTLLAGENSVDTYNFYAKDISSWTLAIDISTSPGANITGLSSYQYRQKNPSEFSTSYEVVNGAPITVITDNSFQGFSKVAYLSNGRYVATISLIGADASGNAPLITTFNMVIKSWQWQ